MTWWLTRNVEWDVRRIRRLRIKAEKEGKVYGAEDMHVYQERDTLSRLAEDRWHGLVVACYVVRTRAKFVDSLMADSQRDMPIEAESFEEHAFQRLQLLLHALVRDCIEAVFQVLQHSAYSSLPW